MGRAGGTEPHSLPQTPHTLPLPFVCLSGTTGTAGGGLFGNTGGGLFSQPSLSQPQGSLFGQPQQQQQQQMG